MNTQYSKNKTGISEWLHHQFWWPSSSGHGRLGRKLWQSLTGTSERKLSASHASHRPTPFVWTSLLCPHTHICSLSSVMGWFRFFIAQFRYHAPPSISALLASREQHRIMLRSAN